MKKILLIVMALCFASLSFAADFSKKDDERWEYVEFTVTSAASSDGKDIGIASEGTCNFNGTWSATIDVEGSVDNTNWDDLVNDVTANGNYSWASQPMRYIRVTGDAYTSGTANIYCVVTSCN